IDAQAPHAEDEQVHGIGDQRQSDDHLERAWAQDEINARCGQDADGEGKNQFHQRAPSLPGVGATAGFGRAVREARGERTDWWASAIRIRTVEPTTSMKTPRSNSKAVASGTRPIQGMSAYWK